MNTLTWPAVVTILGVFAGLLFTTLKIYFYNPGTKKLLKSDNMIGERLAIIETRCEEFYSRFDYLQKQIDKCTSYNNQYRKAIIDYIEHENETWEETIGQRRKK